MENPITDVVGENLEEDIEEVYMDDSDESGWSEETWINNYLSMEGSEYFIEVDDDFIRDDFNLTGLNSVVPYYHHALDILLESEIQDDIEFTEEQHYILDRACEELYGLIHARFIITGRGLYLMYERFQAGKFGSCPRYLCQNQHLLPIGMSDIPRQETVKLYCPKCEDIYHPPRKHSHIDGAFFGTTFAHMLLQAYPVSIPAAPPQKYVPRIFGFKIHPSSRGRLRGLITKTDPQAQQAQPRDRAPSGPTTMSAHPAAVPGASSSAVQTNPN
eukprot:TRINITY_DN6374_c0_g1_i1.p1 TRINITY_DN6374_c0_g1~~TRINITY_DN6374_c0_g1_i1.p1  ORF type:complete len:273 (+),score=54.95 TRINITY_DN6374_c0_g1_i1:337-1155(+)